MLRLVRVMVMAVALTATSAAAAKVRVVTSIQTLGALARAVGGDRVEVISLARGYADPHYVEAKLNLVMHLNRADLLAYVGLDLEIGWLPGLVRQSRNPKIQPGALGHLDCSTVIKVVDVPRQKVDRAMGDIHPRGNPHYWIPPENALRIAAELTRRLQAIDAAGAQTYAANLKRFRHELGRHHARWAGQASRLKGKKVVTYHKSWSYVSVWLGLQEVGYVEPKPGVPPSPKHLAQLVARMKQQGVKLVVVEMFYSRRTAELVARQAGAKLVAMPSDVGAFKGITTYPKLVDAVLAGLAR